LGLTIKGKVRSFMGIVKSALVLLGVTVCVAPSQINADELERALHLYKQEAYEGGCSSGQAQKDFTEIEGRYQKSEELGRIYAAQAEIYMRSPCLDTQLSINYARRALAESLDPLVSMQMHRIIGAALRTESGDGTGKPAANTLHDIALALLHGIRVATDEGVPSEPQALPAGPGGLRGGGPDYEKERKEREASMEEWEAQRYVNKMVDLRDQIERDLVFLFVHTADGEPVLKSLAQREIDDQNTVDRILNKLQIAKDVKAGRPIQWPSILYPDMPREFFEKTTGKTIGQKED